MDKGNSQMDLWDVDIRRMQPFQNNRNYLKNRVSETLGLLYADHFPYRQVETARNVRLSPIHEKLKNLGACFGEASGWERANWFLPKKELKKGIMPKYEYSWKRQNWFQYSADEHNAIRNKVGLFDMSSFGKIKVIGKDAEDVLQRISANNVAIEPGKIIYTQFLNEAGCIEADVTITRLTLEEFLVVTPADTIHRDLNWIKQHIPDNANAIAIDVTVSEAVFVIMGPQSRNFLQPITSNSLSNNDFSFASMQDIDIGYAKARAHRITYVGELGWELYVSNDMSNHVFDTIMKRNDDYPIKLCGLHAMDSCRIEKAYRHYGHDISNEDNVLEAGLGFVVKENKPDTKFGSMIGKNSIIKKRNEGFKNILLQFRLKDPEPLLYHNEPIIRDGEIVGYLTSGNYGHHLKGAIGLGYIKCKEIGESTTSILASNYQIDVAGNKIDADISLSPMYDPKSIKVKN
jgi:4-methylaminobutanoate oxidase (formaldehyde-forming)